MRKAPIDQDEPIMGRGLRLFTRDILKIERKYGSSPEFIAEHLQTEDIILTITGTSRSEGQRSEFVRVHFRCPNGVYLQTFRALDDQPPRPGDDHHEVALPRRIRQSFILRPTKNVLQAAHDLIHNGILIEAHEPDDEEDGTAHFKIHLSKLWAVIPSEADSAKPPVKPPLELTHGTAEPAAWHAAFVRAAEEYLSEKDYETIADRANELTCRRHS